MASNTPQLISVVLCTFNRRRLVMRAIRSILHQTYHQWETIIVDDGSSDGSEKPILAAARKDQRMTYVWQNNQGLALARNTGIRLAHGTYITFLDSDDEYAPRHLERRLRFLEQHPEIDGVYGGMKVTGNRSRQYVVDMDRPGKKIHLSRCHPAGTFFIRRECLTSIGGFRNLVFSEDYDLFQRLTRSYRLTSVPWPTYVYHVDVEDRLCDLYERGGEEAILTHRRTSQQ